jgi:hypothetical protein
VTARRGSSSEAAMSSTTASFAAPSAGGALTRTTSAPSRMPPRPGREERGVTRMDSSTAPEISRTASATACPPSSARGTIRCHPPGPAPRHRER